MAERAAAARFADLSVGVARAEDDQVRWLSEQHAELTPIELALIDRKSRALVRDLLQGVAPRVVDTMAAAAVAVDDVEDEAQILEYHALLERGVVQVEDAKHMYETLPLRVLEDLRQSYAVEPEKAAVDIMYQRFWREAETAHMERPVWERMDDTRGGSSGQMLTHFRQQLWELDHDVQDMADMPSNRVHLERQARGFADGDDRDGDDGTGDDDAPMVMVAAGTPTYKCPLTLRIIDQPIRSRVCRHFYEEAAVLEYLQSGGSTRCPASGCSATISPQRLYRDRGLERRLRKFKSRMDATNEVLSAAPLPDEEGATSALAATRTQSHHRIE